MGLSHSPSIVTDGLVLCLDAANTRSYPKSGTSWLDLSSNGNNGTLTNGPTFSSANGGSVAFDGTNDHVVLSSSYNTASNRPTREITINMWVKFNNFYGQQEIWRATNAIEFDVGELGGAGSGRMSFWINDGGWKSTDYNISSNVGANVWFMVTGIYTNITNRHEFYVNGRLVATGAVGTNTGLSLSSPTTAIGSVPGGANPFNGNISKVETYNRPLSADEVRRNYLATKSRFGL